MGRCSWRRSGCAAVASTTRTRGASRGRPDRCPAEFSQLGTAAGCAPRPSRPFKQSGPEKRRPVLRPFFAPQGQATPRPTPVPQSNRAGGTHLVTRALSRRDQWSCIHCTEDQCEDIHGDVSPQWLRRSDGGRVAFRQMGRHRQLPLERLLLRVAEVAGSDLGHDRRLGEMHDRCCSSP